MGRTCIITVMNKCAKYRIVTLTVILMCSLIFFVGKSNNNLLLTTSKYFSQSKCLENKGFNGKKLNSLSAVDSFLGKAYNLNNTYLKRLQKAQDLCFKYKYGVVKRIIADTKKTVSNCIIPKVGCTFWIGVFRFINNDTDGQIFEDPLHIPRYTIHYANKSPEYYLSLSSMYKEEVQFVRNSFRFMFVRDPYSRLWATWIDKFLLPDFWFSYGSYIAKTLGDTRGANVKCPVNVSFLQFLMFIAQTYPFLYKFNEHWAPYDLLCDPCVFRPHIIGKMETFQQDVKTVMSAANLDWVQELIDKGKQKQALTWQIDIVKDKKYSGESDNDESSELQRTLWKVKRSDAKSNDSKIHIKETHSYSSKTKRDLHIREASEANHNANGDYFVSSSFQLDNQDHHFMHEMQHQLLFTLEGVVPVYPKIPMCVPEDFVAQRLWLSFQYNGYVPKDYKLEMDKVLMNGWQKTVMEAYSSWPYDSASRHAAQRAQKKAFFHGAYREIPLSVLNVIKKIFSQDFEQFGYDPYPDALFDRN